MENLSFSHAFALVITFLVATALLFFIGAQRVLLAALVPAVGFMLSIRSLLFLKRWRIDRRHTR